MVELARRSFLAGLGAVLVAAPAIVRASSLMPVKTVIINPFAEFGKEDLAELMARLDDRGDLFDHAYAERYGLPRIGDVDPLTRRVEDERWH